MEIIMPCFHGDEDGTASPGIRDSLRPLSIPGQSKEQLGQHTAARFWRRPNLWKSMGNPWIIWINHHDMISHGYIKVAILEVYLISATPGWTMT